MDDTKQLFKVRVNHDEPIHVHDSTVYQGDNYLQVHFLQILCVQTPLGQNKVS